MVGIAVAYQFKAPEVPEPQIKVKHKVTIGTHLCFSLLSVQKKKKKTKVTGIMKVLGKTRPDICLEKIIQSFSIPVIRSLPKFETAK